MAPPLVNKSLGRKRIDMKLVTNKSNRMVTFSKRRISLFGKASELSTLCGAHLAVMVFSPGGKMYSFGHPSVEAIVDRYESRQPIGSSKPNHNPYGLDFMRLAPYRVEKSRKLKTELNGTFKRIDMEKTRSETFDTAWERERASRYFWCLITSIKDMTYNQCVESARKLMELKTKLEAKMKIKLSMTMSSNRNEPHYPSFGGVAHGLGHQDITGFGLLPSNFVTGWINFGAGPCNFLPTPSVFGVCPSSNFAASVSDSGNGYSSSSGSDFYNLSLGPYY